MSNPRRNAPQRPAQGWALHPFPASGPGTNSHVGSRCPDAGKGGGFCPRWASVEKQVFDDTVEV
ncbi:MAG: hypothetical protein FWD77_07730 [Betaproteobacteria bacterium]|nr:hypothetical protein [Betaproteobacteria bacterium]